MSKEKEQIEADETNRVQVTNGGGDAVDEEKILRKLDWHLIPGLTFLFLLSFLDRSNGNLSLLFPACLLLTFFQSEMLVSRVSLWIHT